MEETSQVKAGGDLGSPGNIQLNNMASENGSSANGNGCGEGAGKRKKKVIYFADGSTMEDYDDDDDKDDVIDNHRRGKRSVEEKVTKEVAGSLESAPPVDPSKLQWSEWMRHYSSKAGTKTLSVLEGMGGTAAYYLGITTPKYQSEIDEYNRMVAKKKSHEEELVSWSTGPKTVESEQPVVEDVKANGKGEKDESVAVPE